MDNTIREIGLALGFIAFGVALAKNSALSKTPVSIETDSLISFTGRLGVLLLLSSSALQCNQDMLRGIVPDSSVALVR
jgi:hypothetical protein